MQNAKLDTRCEIADHFVDDLVAAAITSNNSKVQQAAKILQAWDRRADSTSVGTLIFLSWVSNIGTDGTNIGGFAEPLDDLRPLETPRGFNFPARALKVLERVASDIESRYGTLEIPWGDVLKFPTVCVITHFSTVPS